MAINEIVKEAIKNNKEQITFIQWAVTQSVASLVYSEYLYNMKNKGVAGRNLLMVPKISAVSEILKEDSQIITWISDHLIDEIIDDNFFKKYLDPFQHKMFAEENIEVLKTILDLYILPNLSKHIPATIARKFSIGDPNNHSIIESNELDLFMRQMLTDDYFKYITRETVLQYMTLINDGVEREDEHPESNTRIELSYNDILSIENNNAICPIKFDGYIIDNKPVIKLLSFVTNTVFDKMEYGDISAIKDPLGRRVDYLVQTSAFNRVEINYLKERYTDPS